MAEKDGDGWAQCSMGHRHWGVHGASGLLAVHHDREGVPHVLMQERALFSHHGGTWGLPGGAMDSHEDAVASALREAWEEAALNREALRVQGVYLDDHGGWTFETVIAGAETLFAAAPANAESTDLRWLPIGDIAARPLHPGFAATWPEIQMLLSPWLVVLDMANIVGARAEHGWWRDRAGAATKLLAEVSGLMPYGLREVPGVTPPLARWFPRVVAVVEGAARAAVPAPGLDTVAASGSGDDAIVGLVDKAFPWERVLVVTADRGLRDRVTALGAHVTGPKWLLSQLGRTASPHRTHPPR
ncbi:ADP-ribose pyrophosphatase YjhB, NUDIX family [Sinosporangium album]|uniref:ADP-ribose pyrophosphatase YjhB, NUDIX family n=1 Tax=Sinosporangium album TaxID=504805 RepID=A0A1G8JSN1_9ACTN|nr:NUDIX hydrolase [Sinosporangium album]SDI34289.1 ADP-ribose pyrophosphatase YjhB, NUDIX family [Sinosporangium album]